MCNRALKTCLDMCSTVYAHMLIAVRKTMFPTRSDLPFFVFEVFEGFWGSRSLPEAGGEVGEEFPRKVVEVGTI